MAKIDITLEKGETILEVDDMIYKAMKHQADGEIHEEDSFQDPAMDSIEDRVIEINNQMLNHLFGEIQEILRMNDDNI